LNNDSEAWETMTVPALSAGVASIVTTNFNVTKMQIMAPFAGLEVPDQPAAPPHILLFIKPAKQCFSFTQPVSFSKVSVSRTGPMTALPDTPSFMRIHLRSLRLMVYL